MSDLAYRLNENKIPEGDSYMLQRMVADGELGGILVRRLGTELSDIADVLCTDEATAILDDPEISGLLSAGKGVFYIYYVAELVEAVRRSEIGEPVFVGKNTGRWLGPFAMTLSQVEQDVKDEYQRRLNGWQPISLSEARQEVYDSVQEVSDLTVQKVRDFARTYGL